MVKQRAVISLVLAMSLLPNLTVHADSVNELFERYDIAEKAVLPEEVSDTIQSYNSAMQYAYMYSGIANSEYNRNLVETRLTDVQSKLNDVESQLLFGFSKSRSELELLEDEYRELFATKADLEGSLNTSDVPVDFDFSNVPSTLQFQQAMDYKDMWLNDIQIGDIEDIKVPVKEAAELISCNDLRTIYKTTRKAQVQAPFNATVSDVFVSDDYGLSVVLDSGYGVTSYVCNLEETTVSIGDEVEQYQTVGITADSNAVFCLELRGDLVNFAKLFVKE